MQVVGGRHQVADPPGTVHASVAGALQIAHRLHPAEDHLHPLAEAQVHGIAGMPRRATVDGQVLLPGHMRGHPSRPDVPHAVLGVVAAIGTQRARSVGPFL